VNVAPVTLRPCPTCADCRGTGDVFDRDADGTRVVFDCPCVFADLSAAESAAVERGGFVVVPAR
jgi:hypothetical protein